MFQIISKALKKQQASGTKTVEKLKASHIHFSDDDDKSP